MNIHFTTFGCKVNLYETENMKQTFSKLGYTICSKAENCDIYVINSCTVTESGDRKIFKELRRLRRENPDAVIAVTGCLPQAAENAAELLPEADIITGTKNRYMLPEIISRFLKDRTRLVCTEKHTSSDVFESMCNEGYTDNTRAFVKIQDGCNMFCTYCIIPYSRGRFRSKPMDELKKEVQGLAEAGYKEIVLVGINLSFYGIEHGLRLADAIEAVCETEGIERVRLGSLEPEMITDDDIKRMAAQKKLCPQFHLSLQSGCDRTLKAMNRRYTAEEYRLLVRKLKASFEHCAVTTDVMVGFPGETDEDFRESAEFIESIGFSRIHVFPYSPRKGTPAAEMSCQISAEVKNHRAAKIMEISDRSHAEFLQSMVGTAFPVLFEREKSDNIPHGYTPNYTLVKIFTKYLEKSLRNRIFYVKIIRLEYDYCVGEIIT